MHTVIYFQCFPVVARGNFEIIAIWYKRVEELRLHYKVIKWKAI